MQLAQDLALTNTQLQKTHNLLLTQDSIFTNPQFEEHIVIRFKIYSLTTTQFKNSTNGLNSNKCHKMFVCSRFKLIFNKTIHKKNLLKGQHSVQIDNPFLNPPQDSIFTITQLKRLVLLLNYMFNFNKYPIHSNKQLITKIRIIINF